MNKGTIIYIGGFELPDKNAAAHRVLNNGKILSELGYKVVFLGISHSAKAVEEFEYSGFLCRNIPYPSGFGSWLRHLASTRELEGLLARFPDTAGVIFYNQPAVSMWRSLKLCRKQGIFTLADATEWYWAAKKNPVFFCVKQADTSLRMRVVQPKLDGVIAISQYLTDYYQKKKCNVLQLPPLVDKADSKWAVEMPDSRPEKLQLVYAGSPGDIKDNLPLVIQGVLSQQDRLQLHVLGIDTLPEELAQGSGSIHFYGRVSHTRCVEMITRSDFQIFLRPENLVTKAGFPTKFPESLACGTPVIANLCSNIGDYLQAGKNGFVVDALTVESVCATLKQVAKLTPEKIAEMKAQCKGEQCFDYRTHIPAVEAFLRGLKR